jgi:hypothetical protein
MGHDEGTDDTRQRLREALSRALTVEANARDLEAPPGLFDEVVGRLEARSREMRELFGGRPPLALVHFDTPGIQEYVFKVKRPVDLFGGSRLVYHFTDPDEAREVSLYRHLAGASVAVPPSAVIYAGGGNGLLLVAASEAKCVAKMLGEILAGATGSDLRTMTAVLEVWPEELSPGSAAIPEGMEEALGRLQPVSRYAAAVAALSARLSRARSRQSRLAEPIPPSRHARRCDACHQRIGEPRRSYEGEKKERLCGSCEARWRYGGQEKQEAEESRTFEDLVRGLPETPLAVLYADGANVGRAFQRLESMTQHRALSLAVDAAMNEAKKKALAASPWLRGKESHRVQTAISGGDDLVLVLPALAVADAVGPLIESFEAAFDLKSNARLREAFAGAPQELRDRIGKFGLGIGIAIADFHFPIQFLLIYARELLKSAKSRIRDGERSAVDFLVLRSGTPLSESVTDLRVQQLKRKPEGDRPGLWLTRRPLSRKEFVELVRRTRLLLDHVPTSQVHAIRREIGRGYELSRSLWRYQHARAKDGKGWAAYREDLGRGLEQVDGLLWSELTDNGRKGWLGTDFLDALDLFDLVQEPRKDDGRIAA